MIEGVQALQGCALHFDCAAGIAGDMAVAALVDLGVPESVVRDALAQLPLAGYSVAFERVKRGALAGMKFRVEVEDGARGRGLGDAHAHADGHSHGHGHGHDHGHDAPHAHGGGHHLGDHPHRHYREIRQMVAAAGLGAGVRLRALAIFDRIAAVEARLHGVSVDDVAFHEVGAVDSIVDIVAVAAALDWLRPSRVTSRAVPLGHGKVHTAHGLLPVPAPATLELLAGAAIEDGGVAFEMTTPTGAAILAATVEAYGELPALRLTAVGWGAGDRELPDRPNLLRVIAGAADDRAAASDLRCVVLEANLDDISPELLAPLVAQLLDAGARDAWITPVVMKKGRPAFVASALCDPERVAAVEAALFAGSTTIGVRRHTVDRTVLPRRVVVVDTPLGAVGVKVSGTGPDENAAPEFEDCARVARERGVPLRRVYAEAIAAYYRR